MDKPAVSEHITKAATALVLEVMQNKRCQQWRKDQLFDEAAKAIGLHPHQKRNVGDMTLREMLELELRSRGKVEYEIEAVEDVLIMWDRWRRES